jgi:hypothetical protein
MKIAELIAHLEEGATIDDTRGTRYDEISNDAILRYTQDGQQHTVFFQSLLLYTLSYEMKLIESDGKYWRLRKTKFQIDDKVKSKELGTGEVLDADYICGLNLVKVLFEQTPHQFNYGQNPAIVEGSTLEKEILPNA